MSDKFHILSLDGGGVRGILSAQILANIEIYLNKRDSVEIPIGKRFDLITGTSTGGLIALGLALGYSAEYVVTFYKEFIPKIFGERNKSKLSKILTQPLYGSGELKQSLEKFFKLATLNDVVTDVCVTSVSLQNAKPRLYKSAYLDRNVGRLDEKLVDIALSTSAAPIYFKPHSAKYSTNLIDGGICANNPSMIGVVDAINFRSVSKRGVPPPGEGLRRPLDDLVVLSIGTGDACAMKYDMQKIVSGGLAAWVLNRDKTESIWHPSPVFPLVEILMNSQSELVHHQTLMLLGEEKYMRINPQLKFPMKLDDVDKVDELLNLSDLTQKIEQFVNRHY